MEGIYVGTKVLCGNSDTGITKGKIYEVLDVQNAGVRVLNDACVKAWYPDYYFTPNWTKVDVDQFVASKYKVGDDVCFDAFAQALMGHREHYKISEIDEGGDGYIFKVNSIRGGCLRFAKISEDHITGLYEEKLKEKPVESDGDKKPSGLQKSIFEDLPKETPFEELKRVIFEDLIDSTDFGKHYNDISKALDKYESSIEEEKPVESDGDKKTLSLLQKAIRERIASNTSTNDPVTHPSHYNQGGIEAIDALEAATCNLSGWKATLTYQNMKYMWRWNEKGKPLEDLKKARFYLDRLIRKVEKEMNVSKDKKEEK